MDVTLTWVVNGRQPSDNSSRRSALGYERFTAVNGKQR